MTDINSPWLILYSAIKDGAESRYRRSIDGVRFRWVQLGVHESPAQLV